MLFRSRLPHEGTVNFDSLKVATGFTRKWNHEALGVVAAKIRGEFWPFRVEYKEDRKASRMVEERFPGLWDDIRPALTLTPKKPYIAVVEGE